MSHARPDVPLELIQTILGLLQRPELLTIRATNKTMNTLATPIAFSELVVTDRVRSAEGLVGLQSCENLVGCVKSVVFRCSTEQNSTEVEKSTEDERLACVPQAMKGLSRFPHVSALRLDFASDSEENWSEPEPSYCLKTQRVVLAALTTGFPLPVLKSLKITGLITRPCDVLASQSFADLLRPIETLEIETVGPDGMEGTYISAEIGDADFWEQMSAVLDAAQSVSTLRLLNDYVFYELAFPSDTRPNLTSIHLRNVMWSHEANGVESFVLNHPALRSLTLEACPMGGVYVALDYGWPFSWAQVLPRLDAGLPNLLELRVIGDDPLGYAYEDPGWGYLTSDADGADKDGEADSRALEKWQMKLELRRQRESEK